MEGRQKHAGGSSLRLLSSAVEDAFSSSLLVAGRHWHDGLFVHTILQALGFGEGQGRGRRILYEAFLFSGQILTMA